MSIPQDSNQYVLMGQPPMFDGENFPLWKARIHAYLQSLGSKVYKTLICKYIAPNKPKKKWSSVEKELAATNDQVLKILHSALDPYLSNELSACSSVFELMQDLENLHGNKKMCAKIDEKSKSCEDSLDCSSSHECESSSCVSSFGKKNFSFDKFDKEEVFEILSMSQKMFKVVKASDKKIKFLELENERLTNENKQLKSNCDSHLLKLKSLLGEKERLVSSTNLHQDRFKSLVNDFKRSTDLCEDLIARNKSLLLSHNVLFSKITSLRKGFCVENDSTPSSSLPHAHSHPPMDSLHVHTQSCMHSTHSSLKQRPIYVCTFCGRHGHLAHFCYDRLRLFRPRNNFNDYTPMFRPTNPRGPKQSLGTKFSSNMCSAGCTKGGET